MCALLLWIPPGGAAVSAAPTEQAVKKLPRNARKLLAEKSLPQMTRMFTDVGGYGIPAIPTLPNSVYSVNSVGGKRFPQNARNSQNLLQRRASHRLARMFTDIGGYGIPAIPTLPNSVNSVNSVGGKRFPQNAWNSQNLLQRRASHRTHGIHRTSCRERTPTDDTDAHRCRRVWHPCHTHADKFCEFCEFCGRKEIPTERTETSGREETPTDGTDAHRLGGYGIPAIPTLPNSVNSVGEQRTLSICVNL